MIVKYQPLKIKRGSGLECLQSLGSNRLPAAWSDEAPRWAGTIMMMVRSKRLLNDFTFHP